MQSFQQPENHPYPHLNPDNFTQNGGGGLNEQNLQQPNNQPRIEQINKPGPVSQPEQGNFDQSLSYEQFRRSNLQGKKPQAGQSRPVKKVQKVAASPAPQISQLSTEEKIKQLIEEFKSLAKDVSRPGVLNRMESILIKILETKN